MIETRRRRPGPDHSFLSFLHLHFVVRSSRVKVVFSTTKMTSNEQQLLADLKENFQDFKCTLQDLRNPTEEFVINFYSYFLQEFEVDINNLSQTQFSQSAIVNAYHEAYSGAIPLINMIKSIKAFDIVKDFGMLDIVSPTPKRTQDILRSFINFYNWADERVSSVRDEKIKLSGHLAKRSEMRKMKEQLRENSNSITKAIPQIRDSKSQLEEEMVVLQQSLTDLRVEKQTYKEKLDELEGKMSEIQNVLQKLNKEDLEINRKVTALSNQVVDSPSAVISDCEVLRQKHDEVNVLRDQKRDMVEAKMETYELLQKLLEEQQEQLSLLEEVLKLIDQLREHMQAASGAEKNTNASQEQLTELKATLLAKSNRKQSCQEKLQSLYLKWKTLKPQLTDNVEYALKDFKDKKEEKNKMINSLKEDTAIQEKIDFTSATIESEVKKVISDWNNLQTQENLMLEQLNENLTSRMKALKKENLMLEQLNENLTSRMKALKKGAARK